MKINFNEYSYFDFESKDKKNYETATKEQIDKYDFNQEYFNTLISNRQYDDAADYASKYRFKNPKVQKEHENDIINLRRNGRILGAIYSKIDDPDKLAQIEFYDKVFVDGGLEQLKNNKYVDYFSKLKKQLGSSKDKEATKLSVTFEPKTQKLLGIDWLYPDNEDNIDNFYANSNLNETKLKNAGVEIIHKDGKTILNFDKSNTYANQIIANLPNNPRSRYGDSPLGSKLSQLGVSIIGYDENNNVVGDIRNHGYIKQLIEKAKDAKETYFKKMDLAEKDYSSTIGPAISDDLTELQEARQSGLIDDTTFNKQFNIRCGRIIDAVKSLGSGGYEMYTNAYNDSVTDETLISVDNVKRGDLINFISRTDPKSLRLLSMCSNGKIGTLVVIDAEDLTAKQKQNLEKTSKPEDQYNTRRIEIFIPGFMQELAQSKINESTTTRSVQEANSMLDWNYSYKCSDGTEITPDGAGGFMINNKEVDKKEAIKTINKDMIIQDAIANLKYQYINWDGDLIAKTTDPMLGANKYEEMARLIAVRGANELDPDIPLLKDDGTNYTVDELFNLKGIINSKALDYEVNDYITQQFSYSVSNKLKNIYQIYDAIMKELNYYNIDLNFNIKK